MSWKVVQISPEEWIKNFSEIAHRAVFKEEKPAYRDRISYALLMVKDEDTVGYVTVREYDNETVYWQFGGVLPSYRKSMTAVKCIESALEWQRKHSLRVLTYVENTNLPMLRFWLAYGFVIIGTRTYKNTVMVDLIKEFKHGDEKPIRDDAQPQASREGGGRGTPKENKAAENAQGSQPLDLGESIK